MQEDEIKVFRCPRSFTESPLHSFYLRSLRLSLLLLHLQTPPLPRSRCAVPHNTFCFGTSNMKLLYIQTFLISFLPVLTSAHSSPSSTEGSPCGTCIQDHEVEGIAQRWLNAFATGGLHTLDSAVTENVRQVFFPCDHDNWLTMPLDRS